MVFESFLGSAGGAAGAEAVRSAWALLEEPTGSEDSVTMEQLTAIGVLKSYDQLFPELDEFSNALKPMVEDYETLRYGGVPEEKAVEITRFIYLPRFYVAEAGFFDEEFALDLENEEVEAIVENALTGFLSFHGISKSDDLVFDVAAIENVILSSEYDEFADLFQ